jgi:hypothetical protein
VHHQEGQNMTNKIPRSAIDRRALLSTLAVLLVDRTILSRQRISTGHGPTIALPSWN